MASTEAPSSSIDPRRLQTSPLDYTHSEDPDSFNDSIDPSFLSSYQSMKNSSSSSPSALGAPADYHSGMTGYDEQNDFPLLSDAFLHEAFDPYHDGLHPNNSSILPSIETAGVYPSIQPNTSSSHLEAVSQGTAQIHSNMPLSRSPRSALRPRTPQISVSTDTAHMQPTENTNVDSLYNGRKGSSPDFNHAPSPSVVVGMWNSPTMQELHSSMDAMARPHADEQFASPHSSFPGMPQSNAGFTGTTAGGSWHEDGNGREGIDPTQRQTISEAKVPNFKDQAKIEEREAASDVIASWRSQVSAVDATKAEEEFPSNFGSPRPSNSTDVTRSPLRASSAPSTQDPETSSTQQPDDIASIRSLSPDLKETKNVIKPGQLYINTEAATTNSHDFELLEPASGISRVEHDGPAVLNISNVADGGATSNSVIAAFNKASDNFSLLSRRATWGTTRHSTENDLETIAGGSLFKRLSISKGAEKKPGFFNSVAKLARKGSSPNKLKRYRSDTGAPSRSPIAPEDNISGAAPHPSPRTPANLRRRQPDVMPRIETNIADLLMPSSHSYHNRRASASNVSPSSSIGDFFGRHIRSRSRSASKGESKSELDVSSGIAEQWRTLGGPPISIPPSPRDDEKRLSIGRHDYSDSEGDDDDEQVAKHDGGLAPNMGLEIRPTLEGFKQNILQLNPKIKPYLIDRLAHQQLVRYKALVNHRKTHEMALLTGSCPSAAVCPRMGNSSRHVESKRKPRNSRVAHTLDDGFDSNPENKLGPESFPPGIPMPPTDRFPAELECQYCFQTKNLQKPSDWTKHIQEDIAPFTCTWEGCKDSRSFKRKADYVRHENEKHRHLESWCCSIDECAHSCHRKDNFQAHLLREHRMREPKAKTKVEIQKAVGYDATFWQLVDSCHRAIPDDATRDPCKFCGKTFKTFKKLSGHEAKHMEQITLPIIALVERAQVDTNTIVSPVGPPPISQQPQTPAGLLSDASPYSQAHSGHLSPGSADFDLYPDSSPTHFHGFSMGHNQAQFGSYVSNGNADYGPDGTMTAQQRGGFASSGTAPMSTQNRFTSASPVEQAQGYGEISPLARQMNQVAMGNTFQRFGNDTTRSMSRSYGSSMVDPTSPANYPVTSPPFGSYGDATTSLPITTDSYQAIYGMATSGPQGAPGIQSYDPVAYPMALSYGGNEQQPAYDQFGNATGMHRSHSNPGMLGVHGNQQQYRQGQPLHAVPPQQQYQVNGGLQPQNWVAESQVRGNRPRSASGVTERTRGGPFEMSQGFLRRM